MSTTSVSTSKQASTSAPESPLLALISPTAALTLLIAAIGHDAGHPGVNNAFLVALNAPLAQLYNDRSVLESFHCAAYSQTLRRHWRSAFADKDMRRLMIDTILATDMGLHFKFMGELGGLREKVTAKDGGDGGAGSMEKIVEGWSDKIKGETRDLLCGLLIKCADICNVVSLVPHHPVILNKCVSLTITVCRPENTPPPSSGPPSSPPNSPTRAPWSPPSTSPPVSSAARPTRTISSSWASRRSASSASLPCRCSATSAPSCRRWSLPSAS